MEERPAPSFRPYLLAALVMLIGGWGGLALLINFTLPTIWPRWGFFALWSLALTGAALPVVYFFNRRFPSTPPAEPNVILRQAIWVGIFGATLAWLQLGRVVTLWIILGLAGGLAAVEWLIRMRERSRWRLPTPSESPLPNSQSTNPQSTDSQFPDA